MVQVQVSDDLTPTIKLRVRRSRLETDCQRHQCERRHLDSTYIFGVLCCIHASREAGKLVVGKLLLGLGAIGSPTSALLQQWPW